MPDDRDELSPEQEAQFVLNGLREQVGIHPDKLWPILDLGAVGLVNGAWRNSPVEDWHTSAAGPDDGAMMRINAHTTWRVRAIIQRWAKDAGLDVGMPADRLDGLDSELIDRLTYRIFRWLTNPSRTLPTGMTLAELAGDDLEEYVDHADESLGRISASAQRRGARFTLSRAAIHGGLACNHWWGTPGWPGIVDQFIAALDDQDHPHWRPGSARQSAWGTEPASMAGRNHIRRVLLNRPWDLSPEEATWITSYALIGFLRPTKTHGN